MISDWKEKKIKEFCDFKYGKNLPEHARLHGKYPVYGSASITSYHNDYLIEAPGIIIGRKGTVGKVQLAKDNFYPIDTTFYIDRYSTAEDIIFLYYRLQLCGFSDMNSDAAVPGLNRNAAINQKIKLPPIATQQKIAAILSAYDDLIENNLKRIKLLEEMAQITYEEWFVRLKFPGHETTPMGSETGLPVGWEEKKLGEIISLNYGKSLTAENRLSGSVPVYGSAGIVGQHNESIVKGPGVIVGRKGNVGFIFWSNDDFYPIDTVFFVSSNLPLLYIRFLLSYITFVNNDAAVPGLNRNAAYLIKCAIPPISLIEQFAAFVTPLFQTIRNLNSQNQLLKEARDILLPRLMTGMIDVEQLNHFVGADLSAHVNSIERCG